MENRKEYTQTIEKDLNVTTYTHTYSDGFKTYEIAVDGGPFYLWNLYEVLKILKHALISPHRKETTDQAEITYTTDQFVIKTSDEIQANKLQKDIKEFNNSLSKQGINIEEDMDDEDRKRLLRLEIKFGAYP